MEKAIYGLAMPFNDIYWEYDRLANTLTLEKTNKDSVHIDSLVGATLRHDYNKEKELGRTDQGTLFLHVNERGVFFKVIPTTPFGLSCYKKVKKGKIRHCSISYYIHDRHRNYQEEKRVTSLLRLLKQKENIIIWDYKKILVFFVCICEKPANDATFCTTDPNHPLLKEVIWDE